MTQPDLRPATPRRRGWITALGLGLLGAAAAWTWVATQSAAAPVLHPDDPDVVRRGHALYATHCASCHGKNLAGQPEWRRRRADGRLPAPPHDATGHTWHHPTAQLLQLTLDGPAAVVGGDYQSDMPGFRGTLDEVDALAVLSYIKSTWPAEIRERHDVIESRHAH
ncbi:MAG: cytochrome c [Ectothiorhodospiraceae bacterium]|nr:cytochrome c [Ectothiorhodospiraceae bacterium]